MKNNNGKDTKKLLSLILCGTIICSFLVSCDNIKKPENYDYSIEANSVDGYKTKLIPDTSVTGELNISTRWESFDGYDIRVTPSIDVFKALYPNVKVNVERFENTGDYQASYDEYYRKLNSDLISGNGPDVFWPNHVSLGKLRKAGILANLDEHFKNDTDFSMDDYNERIFKFGAPGGKQDVVPLSYHLPLCITTKGTIDKTGFNPANCTDFVSTSAEISNAIQKNKMSPANPIINNFITHSFLDFSGVEYFDLATGLYDLDTPQMQSLFETYKKDFYGYKTLVSPTDEDAYLEFRQGNSLFIDCSLATFRGMTYLYRILSKVDEPVIFPFRDLNGQIQAVPSDMVAAKSNSKNIDNAYRFIKILISPEMQSGTVDNSLLPLDSYGVNALSNNLLNYELPISNYAVQKILESQTSPFTVQEDGKIIEAADVSDDLISQYLNFIGEATMGGCPSYNPMNFMMPYLKGEAEYSECIRQAQTSINAKE